MKPADEAAAAAADDDSDVKRGRKRRSRSKRNRAPPESPDKQFFAELRYDDYDSATVVTCTIIGKSRLMLPSNLLSLMYCIYRVGLVPNLC